MVISESRPPSRRGKKQRQEPCFEQHAVGLIAGKILGRADEGEKADKTDQQHGSRPQVYGQQQRGGEAGPTDPHDHV